jgi:hypothetical protein
MVLVDQSYKVEALRRDFNHYRMQPVIRQRSIKRMPRPDLPRLFDRPKSQ